MLIGGQTVRNHHAYYDVEEDNDGVEVNLFSSMVWVFDWNTIEWKHMKRLRKGRHSHSCAQTMDKKFVVVAGGLTEGDEPSLSIEIFDVATEEWRLKKSSKLPWHVVGIPFILYQGAPTLFRSGQIDSFKDDKEKEVKSSSNVGLLKLTNNGDFTEFSSFPSSMVTVRSYGVLLVVPEVLVCLS